MTSESQPVVLAPWKIRLIAAALILFGGVIAAFSWASLQRPDVKATCQYEYTADPQCKRGGIWAGLVFMAFGLPVLLAPSRWLKPRGVGD